jgi:LacI family transcriptional regulator/LacI family repressor for deo operon, udp, cdd, tsx, nupC, and nupG
MQRRPVSLHDIAREAGVSHSTVSRALRDSALISADVRARIHAIAAELGYVPNAVAQSLQGSRTRAVGVLVTTISDPFFTDVVAGMEAAARPAGYSLLLTATHNDPVLERQGFAEFRRRRVDGFVLASSRGMPDRDAFTGCPLVLVNSAATRVAADVHAVAVDDRAGARMAMDHLIALGHRCIGYLGAVSRAASNRRRRAGYRDALRAAGIAFDEDLCLDAPSFDAEPEADVAAGCAYAPQLLARGVTAIFCYNDMIAIGALQACRALRVAVPQQISIVGFDDVSPARYCTPELTTVHQPRAQLGAAAMQLLFDLLDGRAARNRTLEPQLVVRASTASFDPLRAAQTTTRT